MQIRLEYGRDGLDVEIPDKALVGTLAYKTVAPLPDPQAAVARVLRQPLGAPPLAELAEGRSSACILICDVTRPVPNEIILTPLLETLEQAGIDREKILILIATGLHRPSSPAEIREMVGQRIAADYAIENHDGLARDDHVDLGLSPNGVPILIDRRYFQADLKLTVGLIEPHFMAGFSGGRKLICPGIAGLETIRAWHSPRFLESPHAISGRLAKNPVHEENTWIARQAGCDFIVNVVIDAQRRPLQFVAGDMIAAFEQGVDFVRQVVLDTLDEPVDIVVTSSAGYPLDTTFYQSIKGMVAAATLVKQGGSIVIAASLTEGVGSDSFASLFEAHDSLEQFMQEILDEDYFVMDQWQLEKMASVCRKAEVTVVSQGIPAQRIEQLFVKTAPTVEDAVARAMKKHGPECTIAVIPKGPYVLAELAADKST